MDAAARNLIKFERSKTECLTREDLSRKGSIDEPIRHLVDMINNNQYYYTTSTCSGRISLLEKPNENAGKKKGNIFLLNSHQPVELDQLLSVIQTFTSHGGSIPESCLWLKFEPFILHVQCFDLFKAKEFLNIALASGCRNSGMTLGKDNKILVAVRSTSILETPVCCQTLFQNLRRDYIEFLMRESNFRLAQNFERLARFERRVQDYFEKLDNPELDDRDEVKS